MPGIDRDVEFRARLEAIARALAPIPLLGAFPYDHAVVDADLAGEPPYPTLESIPDAARDLLKAIREFVAAPA